MNNKHYIGSSEFDQWNYCPRMWYLEQTTARHGPVPMGTVSARRRTTGGNMSEFLKCVLIP